MAHDEGKLQRLPSALDKVLERLSIVDGHPLGCPCPACTRAGNALELGSDCSAVELEQQFGGAA
jgi:hypothetical protein